MPNPSQHGRDAGVRDEFMVVLASAWASPGVGFGIGYDCDYRRFPNRTEAVKHGFALRGSDDFNIVIVRGDQLIWFGWMEKEIKESRKTMAAIAAACDVKYTPALTGVTK